MLFCKLSDCFIKKEDIPEVEIELKIQNTTATASWNVSTNSNDVEVAVCDLLGRFRFEKKLEKGESGFIAVDAYGHLGGLIKFFMAFAGLWLLAGGMQAFWPLFIVMVLIGAAQYFVEASVLIPQSQALFSHKPNEYASPTHTLGNGAFSGFKWMLVLGHALGQGLGFFACMAIVGSIAPPLIPLAIAIGVAAMLVIGPSTGRFYGERFFRWGAGIACNPNEDGQYSIAALSTALIAKSVSQRSIDAALRVLRVGNGGLLDTEDKKKQQADDGMVPSEIPSAESFLRYFGYYLNEPVKHAWQDLSWLQKGLYGLGGAVGCFGAAFKGALAFAGTVVFLLLCTAQTLFVLATPPGWIIAAAMVIGVATWMVQCARACPNTANGFVSWTVSKAAETAYAGPERPGQVASTGLHAGPDDETLSDSDQYNREGFESKVKLFGGSERAADGGLAPVPVSGTTTTTNTDGRVVIITSM